ncbi:hypothetical protein psyc5s11_27120 [Clostridium gelidum]|uniref:Uncharacterized protein n=1 Tax=Clostridium gelidum TaxID=704125 RepID=A0ABM7T5X0_9CLOT|nr:hypothetical protein psyc5s11_27120 [Clostridium gelidum]
MLFSEIVKWEKELKILRIGLQSEIRLFGTIIGNMFRVYFVDYYHDFEFDK